MNEKIQKNYILFTAFISAGILLRFIAMSLGHNFDFESHLREIGAADQNNV